MKKYILSLSLLAFMFLGCEPIERTNAGNPQCCMLDSVSIHYYLTTKKNELTTTYRQGECIKVHYDLCNQRKIKVKNSEYNIRILVDSCNPYLNALHGKCYTMDGQYVESMSFSSSPLRVDQDWSDHNTVPLSTITLGYLDSRSYEQTVDITIPSGEYYFETFPKISFLTPIAPGAYWDTITHVSPEPLRIYFTVITK